MITVTSGYDCAKFKTRNMGISTNKNADSATVKWIRSPVTRIKEDFFCGVSIVSPCFNPGEAVGLATPSSDAVTATAMPSKIKIRPLFNMDAS